MNVNIASNLDSDPGAFGAELGFLGFTGAHTVDYSGQAALVSEQGPVRVVTYPNDGNRAEVYVFLGSPASGSLLYGMRFDGSTPIEVAVAAIAKTLV